MSDMPDLTLEILRQIRDSVDRLTTRVDGVREDLNGVRKDLDGVRRDLDGVRKDLDGVRKDLEGLTTRVDGLTTRVDGLNNRVDALGEQMYDYRMTFREFRQDVSERFDRLTTAVQHNPEIERRVEEIERRLQIR